MPEGKGRRSSILRDGSSRQNVRSASVPRRLSMSLSAPSTQSDGEKKDRRAMLEEWRRQVKGRENTSSRPPAIHDDRSRSSRPLPIHPSTAFESSETIVHSEGTTAVERFRMRRQQRQLHQQQHQLQLQQQHCNPVDDSLQSSNAAESAHSNAPSTSSSRSVQFAESNEEDLPPIPKPMGGFTPSRSRRLTISGSAGKARRRSLSAEAATRVPTSPAPVQEIDPQSPLSQQHTMETTTSSGDGDTVEDVGQRSRMLEMQQRINQLEKEKMALAMSMAPLESRHRQKEDAWTKDRKRLNLVIEDLQAASIEADERFRALQLKNSDLEDEYRKVLLETRKMAAANVAAKGENDKFNSVPPSSSKETEVSDLQEKLRNAEDEINSLRLEKVSIESEVSGTRVELESVLRNYDELREEFEELSRSKSENADAEIRLEVLTREHIATSAQLNAVCADLAETKSKAQAELDEIEVKWKKETADLRFEVSVMKTRGAHVDKDQKDCDGDTVEDEAVLRARIEARDARILDLEQKLLKGEQIRRKMHNRIQELRGNIRVFVRTRPFLPGDGQSTDSSIEVMPDGEALRIQGPKGASSHDFRFDRIFPQSAGQDTVFDEVSEFVQSALDGYHVCLFSYGQTGSGKTHTMQGSGTNAMRGIIPRAVEQILDQAKAMQAQKWNFVMSASFLEIYNEELKDLLNIMTTKRHGQEQKPMQKLAIKRDNNGKSYVDGLTQVDIDTEDSSIGLKQLENVMQAAAKSRSVASTKMNNQSSRSHSVFILRLRGTNEDSGTVVDGVLNLCDLAGSERLDRSGVASDTKRLRETQAINKSLSCLGDVFTALASGSAHVPYRNSKLTYLLQDCLSGDGKALMFVNLSPTTMSSAESLCSLRFAQRVNQVELGKPTKHVQYSQGSKGSSRR